MNWDQAQSLVRSVLKIGAGYFVAKGVISGEESETLVAAAVALAGVLWGIKHRKPTSDKSPPITPALLLCCSIPLITGCATHYHARPVMLADGKVFLEEERDRTFLMLGKATQIKSRIKDGGYDRTLSVGELQGQGDSQMIDRLFDGIGKAAGVAARTAAGLPPAP